MLLRSKMCYITGNTPMFWQWGPSSEIILLFLNYL